MPSHNFIQLHINTVQSLELLMKKRGNFLVGLGVCILEANLKKSSTPKFMMTISFIPSICPQPMGCSLKKKCGCRFFSTEAVFPP